MSPADRWRQLQAERQQGQVRSASQAFGFVLSHRQTSVTFLRSVCSEEVHGLGRPQPQPQRQGGASNRVCAQNNALQRAVLSSFRAQISASVQLHIQSPSHLAASICRACVTRRICGKKRLCITLLVTASVDKLQHRHLQYSYSA